MPQRNNTVLKRLKEYLQNLCPGGIALAFSGGTDSALLLAVLAGIHREKEFPLVALTMQTILQDPAEIEDAAALARSFNVTHRIFSFNPFDLEQVRNNRPDRCYHCKKAIFSHFGEYARVNGLTHLLDGTNADDLQVYRPGRKALRELGVISPLAELGITKAQIREMSAALNLKTAGKPASPCLATRFEYNTRLSEETINRVAAGEKLIRQTFPVINNIRLRIHGSLARIEVPAETIPQVAGECSKIIPALKDLGFAYISLDLEGFRSGSFDTKN